MLISRQKNAIDFFRAARLGINTAPKQIEESENLLSEEDAQPLRAKTGATRLQEDIKSLMDVTALSQGARNGRRIAKQFSKGLWSNRVAAPGTTVSVRPSTRSAAVTIALAEKRSFSNIIKFEELDERVKTDFALFVGEGQIARVDDVSRVIPSLTRMEAREMIWIADLEDRGGVSLFDLLDTLTTVWEGEFAEPEIVPSRGRGNREIESAATFQIE